MRLEHRRREPAPGVFRLVLPLPFPGLDRVNAYLLAGGIDTTLVDCGIYYPDEEDDHGWADVEAAIGACGMAVTDIKRLIVTHSHIDHYGMAATFVERAGCDLWMHDAVDDDLAAYRDPEGTRSRLRELFREHGVEPEEVDELVRFEDWRGFVSGLVEPDVKVSGSEEVEIGPRTWQFVYTPGHSRSHICLASLGDGLLISGDHLLPTITPHIDYRRGAEDDPLGDFLKSLDVVEKLDPRLVLPGHGRPFEEGAERARIVARHHDRRLGAILQIVRHEPHTADEITDQIFGTTLLNFERRLALGEALAHIRYLARRGEIVRTQRDDGTFVYQKASRRRRDEDD
ncbi:MAG: MBL fold metallo-hydrolase [Actinobacteria bacterium]|nr:MBL fold metallo-hydrolase [Actinomycetota bacterium]